MSSLDIQSVTEIFNATTSQMILRFPVEPSSLQPIISLFRAIHSAAPLQCRSPAVHPALLPRLQHQSLGFPLEVMFGFQQLS